jgi:hypothetical protein
MIRIGNGSRTALASAPCHQNLGKFWSGLALQGQWIALFIAQGAATLMLRKDFGPEGRFPRSKASRRLSGRRRFPARSDFVGAENQDSKPGSNHYRVQRRSELPPKFQPVPASAGFFCVILARS